MSARLAVLVSGRGSNLRALLEAIDAGRCDARVAAVIADRDCPALAFASERGIAIEQVPRKPHPSREAWDAALAAAIDAHTPEWVVLAGFMRIVGASVLARFGGRILNVHPSLLPAFPGLHAPRQAIEAGARLTGCTVHLVDAGVDTGPILAQAALAIAHDDDEASLHARIQRLEHRLLPEVVHALSSGELTVEGAPRWRARFGGAHLQTEPPETE